MAKKCPVVMSVVPQNAEIRPRRLRRRPNKKLVLNYGVLRNRAEFVDQALTISRRTSGG